MFSISSLVGLLISRISISMVRASPASGWLPSRMVSPSDGRLREYRFYNLLRAAPIGIVFPLDGQLCHLYQSELY
ncbi:hypothetical protein [Turicimonas muris]|uniref:hypothetical protein n=1 Tax=Turicimonas muris TaxID=1796652 RepID=UPI0024BBEB35|nr:hypothetical protein [Turicimonas muris]